MRFLLSTVAATALMATPALAQTLENDVTEAPEAAEPMGPGIDFSQLEQDLSAAGYTGAQELHGAEVYYSTFQGQQALIIIMDEQFDDVAALGAPIDDPAVTDAIPEDDSLAEMPDDPAVDDDLAELDDPAVDDELAETPADPAFPAEDDELAETPADPAFPEQDDELAEMPDDPAIDDELAEAPEIDDPDVTATVPGVGVEDDLSQAGFQDPQRTTDGQVFRTTTEDGRTMLIVLAADFGAQGIDTMEPAAPELAPEEPDLEMEEVE